MDLGSVQEFHIYLDRLVLQLEDSVIKLSVLGTVFLSS